MVALLYDLMFIRLSCGVPKYKDHPGWYGDGLLKAVNDVIVPGV